MDSMKTAKDQFFSSIKDHYSKIAIVLLLVVAGYGFAVVRKLGETSHAASGSTLDASLARVKKDGVLRAAYAGFPPYTIINLNETDPAKRVTGFSVDLVNEIAKRQQPPLRVEWYSVNFETMKAEIDAGTFDLIADPIYQTVTRSGAGFGLCEPFTYVGNGLGIVRKEDSSKFSSFRDLDRPDITIAVAIGYATTDFAQQNLAKPKWKLVSVSNTAVEQFDEVVAGRADIALNDTPSVIQYARAHAGKVQALWVDNPPSFVAAGFLTRERDITLTRFLSESVRALQVDGTIERLDQKWQTLGYFKRVEYLPAKGLGRSD